MIDDEFVILDVNGFDPKLVPTYEGGCPSRYCYPKGYNNHAGEKVIVNKLGYTYDGIPLSKSKHPVLG